MTDTPSSSPSVRPEGARHPLDVQAITPAQIAVLADACPPHLRAMVLVGAYGGMSWAELTALTAGAVDVRLGTIRVERRSGRSGPTTRRLVYLPPSVVEVLMWHFKRTPLANPDAFIFTTLSGRRLRRADFTNVWREATHAAGLGSLQLRDFRNWPAKLALTIGATPVEIRALLGRSTPSAESHFPHLVAERGEATAARLDALVMQPRMRGRTMVEVDVRPRRRTPVRDSVEAKESERLRQLLSESITRLLR